jgi:hypothetical protein
MVKTGGTILIGGFTGTGRAYKHFIILFFNSLCLVLGKTHGEYMA